MLSNVYSKDEILETLAQKGYFIDNYTLDSFFEQWKVEAIYEDEEGKEFFDKDTFNLILNNLFEAPNNEDSKESEETMQDTEIQIPNIENEEENANQEEMNEENQTETKTTEENTQEQNAQQNTELNEVQEEKQEENFEQNSTEQAQPQEESFEQKEETLEQQVEEVKEEEIKEEEKQEEIKEEIKPEKPKEITEEEIEQERRQKMLNEIHEEIDQEFGGYDDPQLDSQSDFSNDFSQEENQEGDFDDISLISDSFAAQERFREYVVSQLSKNNVDLTPKNEFKLDISERTLNMVARTLAKKITKYVGAICAADAKSAAKLEEAEAKNQGLEQKVQMLEEQNKKLRMLLTESNKNLNSYKPGFFGFYIKVPPKKR